MAKLNTLIYLNAYEDAFPSNNPNKSNFKWTRELNSVPVSNPSSSSFSLAPGETRSLFNGSRTLLQDMTTEYSISLVPGTTNTYQLTWVGGTAPQFRTPRTSGADATTEINVTLNGPVVTFSSVPSSFASFSGLVPGMTSSVVITANNSGTAGNSAVLYGNGSSSISTLITAWNTANPSNQITLTSGNGLQVPDAAGGMYASFSGIVAGTATSVTITANNIGTVGNAVALTGNGSSSISTLITAWNTANPSNQITLTSGDGTQIPSAGTAAFFTGVPAGLTSSITITANNIGTGGNSVVLIGDGLSSIDTLIANWNIGSPSNQITLTAGIGTQIPNNLDSIDLAGGTAPAAIDLAGGINPYSMQLSGGASPTPLSLISGGVIVGDFVRVGSNFNILNQGQWQIISVTATSFSVVNYSGVAEGPILLGSGFTSQLDFYSAAGVQVGDTLVISGGFSPFTQGSYTITGVADGFVQFSSTAILPIEGPITTDDISIYYDAQRLVYLEADQHVTFVINGVPAGEIVPLLTCTGALAASAFLRTSIVYSMTVTNASQNTANLFFAAVE